jgi:hypothetical protein
MSTQEDDMQINLTRGPGDVLKPARRNPRNIEETKLYDFEQSKGETAKGILDRMHKRMDLLQEINDSPQDLAGDSPLRVARVTKSGAEAGAEFLELDPEGKASNYSADLCSGQVKLSYTRDAQGIEHYSRLLNNTKSTRVIVNPDGTISLLES